VDQNATHLSDQIAYMISLIHKLRKRNQADSCDYWLSPREGGQQLIPAAERLTVRVFGGQQQWWYLDIIDVLEDYVYNTMVKLLLTLK